MRTTIFLLLLSFLSIKCFSTEYYISYNYDDAGNRISRQCVEVLLRKASAGKPEIQDTITIESQIGDTKITVYPNPTKGALAVDISGCAPEQKLEMKLYSPTGALLQKIPTSRGKTPIDMNAYPSGWYILRIFVDNKPVEFKIIKN